MSGLRVSRTAQLAVENQAGLEVALVRYQKASGLSDIEMLQAVNSWAGMKLKYMLTAEADFDDESRDGT